MITQNQFPSVISRNSTIRVETSFESIFRGKTFHGTVISAMNYGRGDQPEWYIEMTDDRIGYVYIKQNNSSEKLEGITIEG